MDLSLKKNLNEQNEKCPTKIIFTPMTTSYFSPNYCQNFMSNLYLPKTASRPLPVINSKIKDIDTPSNNSPDPVFSMAHSSTNYQSMSNLHSILYLSMTASDSLVEKPKSEEGETPTYTKPSDIVNPTETTSHFTSPNYQSMSNSQSNLYLSKIPSESSGVEKPKIKDVKTSTYIKPIDIVYPTTTASHFTSPNYQSMSNSQSNLYLSKIPSESSGVEKPKIRDIEAPTCITYIKPPDTVYPTVTTSLYSSSKYQSMSNFYLSGIPSKSLGVVKPKIKDVETPTCITYIKPPDTVYPTVTTSHYSSSNYQSMSNSQSNLYLSKIPSESSGVEKPRIRDVETSTYIKPIDSIYPMPNTSHCTSSYSRRTSNLYSNLYLMMTAPESLRVEKPKFRLIKTINEANPFDSFVIPETTSHFPSKNDQGISPKVIDYVLKCKKSVADQSVVNRKEADSSMCSINKNNSVNYDTTSENQMPLEVPSMPTMNKRRKKPNILLKSNRAIRKCVQSIPKNRLQPINKRMYEESLKIYNFSNTNRQIESTSNNEQNDFPQISYPTIQPSNSIDEKYSSGTLSTQLKPHPTDIEIPEKSEIPMSVGCGL